jgi:hypothetical protein
VISLTQEGNTMINTKTTLTVNSPAEAFAELLRVGLEFRVSESLWGHSGAAMSTGWLPGLYRDAYLAQTPVYTVYSYLTPIAWLLADGVWIMPMVKYSPTTTRAQNKINDAVALIN